MRDGKRKSREEEEKKESKWQIEKSKRDKNKGRKKSRERIKYKGLRYIAYHYKNIGEKGLVLMPSNKFEILKDKLIKRGEESGSRIGKDRKMILREQRAKKVVEV